MRLRASVGDPVSRLVAGAAVHGTVDAGAPFHPGDVAVELGGGGDSSPAEPCASGFNFY